MIVLPLQAKPPATVEIVLDEDRVEVIVLIYVLRGVNRRVIDLTDTLWDALIIRGLGVSSRKNGAIKRVRYIIKMKDESLVYLYLKAFSCIFLRE